MAQLHKRFTDSQVMELIERYLRKAIKGKHLQEVLGLKKRRFLMLVSKYRENPSSFTIAYQRKTTARKIESQIENNIIKELKIEKKLIEDKNVPLKSYNYSYIKDRLEIEYDQRVSLPTIIDRAKKNDFYLGKRERAAHDREVLTNYVRLCENFF